jgi:hypothetical protein
MCESYLTCGLSRRIARRYVNIPDYVDKQVFNTLDAQTHRYDNFCS